MSGLGFADSEWRWQGEQRCEDPALFPYLTRIFWLLVQPLSLVVLLLVAGLALSWLRRRWISRVLLGLALLLLFICCFTTFGYVLITPLEQRFERPAEPARIDGIVVLGGGLDGEVNSVRGGYELNRSGDRFVEALRLALIHPNARIVIAGGPAALVQQEPEARAGERLFEAFGVAADRILLDDQSRNTEENAQFAKQLAGATEGQTWLLVTSAFHMPRAVGLFRKADFPVVPWPADYLASGAEGVRIKPDQSPENMAVSSIALREWAGLLGYYLTGRIDEVLPGP
ncbi:MAG TPA: YdcF family protein [Devosia sp.]|uniref:YdcF family protein n=1 Tax=Devosia sp. TaxID=1871048 RepID=UPI002DDCAEE7|nr:YdcF family protein [Devosia sp.]HEV2518249.1 YdcF family protein [Devosia sp.]